MKISSLFHTLPRLTRGKAWFAGSAVVVLSVAGAAVAASSPASTSAVMATFTATSVANKNVQSCTGSDGNYEFTQATYTGTSTSADPHLSGPITLDVSSVYNTSKNLGWVTADVQVASSTAGDSTNAKLTAVDANGTVQGFLVSGKIGSGNGDGGHGNGFNLAANVTGSFTGAGGFTAGSLGTGAATDTAVITAGSCKASSDGDNDNDNDSGGHSPTTGSFGTTGATGPTGPTGSFGSKHDPKHGPSLGHGDDK
jgi:hypothetical protein